MRIESISYYKYFFQLIQKEPVQLKRYSIVLILIPLLTICYLSNWNAQVLFFMLFGYISAIVGFLTGHASRNSRSLSFKKQFYHQLVTEHTGDPMLLVNNREQRIVFVNDAFYQQLGFVPQTVLDIRFEDFVDVKHQRKIKNVLSRQNSKDRLLSLQTPRKSAERIEIRKGNGKMIWAELSSKVVGEDKDFTLYTLKEITQQVKQENAMVQFAKDLIQRKKTANTDLRIRRQHHVLLKRS